MRTPGASSRLCWYSFLLSILVLPTFSRCKSAPHRFQAYHRRQATAVAYVPVPVTTTRTSSGGETTADRSPVATATNTIASRAVQQPAATFVRTKATKVLAEMPAALRPPTASCVKASFRNEGRAGRSGNAATASHQEATKGAAAPAESQEDEEYAQALHVKHIKNSGAYPVLVVNADWQPLSYLPLSVMRWQDAIKAIFLERVVVLERYDAYIQSTRAKVQLPSVICLKGYVKRHKETKTPALNRRNVFIRDQYRCQYCLVQMTSSDLTLDHVIPKSKGGKGSWENLVTACSACNRQKGRKSLKEVKAIGMQLLRPPKRPTTAEIQQVARSFKVKHFVHETWQTYLGY